MPRHCEPVSCAAVTPAPRTVPCRAWHTHACQCTQLSSFPPGLLDSYQGHCLHTNMKVNGSVVEWLHSLLPERFFHLSRLLRLACRSPSAQPLPCSVMENTNELVSFADKRFHACSFAPCKERL